MVLKPLKCQPHKIVKHTQTTRRLLPFLCLTILRVWRLKD